MKKKEKMTFYQVVPLRSSESIVGEHIVEIRETKRISECFSDPPPNMVKALLL